LEVLPYKESYSGIAVDHRISAVVIVIVGFWTFNRNIVYIRDGNVGYFFMENMGDIIVEYRD
jgi:hypothetical protein